MHVNWISRHRPRVARHPSRRPRRWPRLAALSLAAMSLVTCLTAAYPAAATGSADPSAGTGPCSSPGTKAPSCYSPQAYQAAYGVAPLLSHGIDGRGETVVVGPEPATSRAASGTNIRKDLTEFDTTFGLPPTSLRVVNLVGSATPYLAGGEEVGDTEMVHAIAPGASLDVILTPADTGTSPATFASAITETIQEGVALHAAVISISASVGEHSLSHAEIAAMNAALEQARDQHATVVTSSGDEGAISSHEGPPVQVNLPASDPLALGVGGTILDLTTDGSYLGEMAWNDNREASGGGYSSLFPRPSYQDGLTQARATRGVPDVAANADPSTAMAQETSDGELLPNQGTSASTPLRAGLIALADQEAGQHLGFVNPALYAIARSPAYHQAFHDVVTGDNSVIWPTGVFVGYNARPGWDPVTGLGSPDAQYLVPLLAHTARRLT
jgi:subtilase family serine protease